MASILAIGTANPSNFYYQADYPDFYFRVTGSDHMTELKEKYKRICEKSKIRKRHLFLTEDIIKENPSICSLQSPSLNARQKILITEVPKLGKEAADKAIKEWGQPISNITHLIFCTSSGAKMPSADYSLAQLLGLPTTVQRFMMYQQGCCAGVAALRLAKDVAENNPGARVLIVCSENTAVCFRAPSETHIDILVGSSLFADGAAAVIVGANPDTTIERPLFQLMLAEQCTIPDTEHLGFSDIGENGGFYHLHRDLPEAIAKNAAKGIVETFSNKFGITDWNSLFYIVHHGGPAVLDKFEAALGLKDKLRSNRHVLSEYGNMWSCSVLFALDEMRKKSAEEGKATTGEGLEMGVLVSVGPGVTMETIVLRSFPTV